MRRFFVTKRYHAITTDSLVRIVDEFNINGRFALKVLDHDKAGVRIIGEPDDVEEFRMENYEILRVDPSTPDIDVFRYTFKSAASYASALHVRERIEAYSKNHPNAPIDILNAKDHEALVIADPKAVAAFGIENLRGKWMCRQTAIPKPFPGC